MINLELKHFCPDFDKVRKVLRELGAKKETIKTQKDYFFGLPAEKSSVSGRLKLRVEGKKQKLVYYERPDFSAASGAASSLGLYDVEDDKLLPFLKRALGVAAIVEKKREVWRKANTVFHLDTVKGAGNIFEVELQKKGTISEKDRKMFKSYQDKLLPVLGDVIKGSNIDLVLKK